MPIYVTLIKSTAETVKSIGDVGKWYEESTKMAEQMGIKMISAYALLGRYDMMLIYEAPDEKAVVSLSLSGTPRPGVQSETWTAIPIEEFAKLAARLKG